MYLGTAMSDGSMTSIARVAPENGVATVVVNAKRYGADTDPVIILSLLDEDGVQAAVEVVDAQKSATYHSVAFSGLDDSKTYAVKVANRGKSKRVTLYSAMAFSGDCADCDDIDYDKALEGVLSSSSAPARAEQTVSGERITITGITDTSYKVTGLSNIIYRYRVKAVPADPEKGKESLWSATSEIDLSTSGVTVPVAGEAASAFILVNGEIVATPGARPLLSLRCRGQPLRAGPLRRVARGIHPRRSRPPSGQDSPLSHPRSHPYTAPRLSPDIRAKVAARLVSPV